MTHNEKNLGQWGKNRGAVQSGLTPGTCWKVKAGPVAISFGRAEMRAVIGKSFLGDEFYGQVGELEACCSG
jgi:hypothetical protein